jgi:hypothetical protein
MTRPLMFAAVALATLAFAAEARAADLPKFKGFSAWSLPVNLGPPVNTTYAESAPAFSADGLSLYFNRNFNGLNPDQPGKVDEDLYVAQRTNRREAWGNPLPLEALNTTFHERNAAVSRDGRLFFFSSDRQPGGSGGLDLYVSHRGGSAWSAPVNLGAAVNSTADDVGPAYFQNPGGTDVLYFTSNRPGRGGFDIYASQVGTDGAFGIPLLVGELSSASNDARTAIRADGLEVVFHSNRLPSTGLADLWVSTRPTVLDPWGAPASLGSVVNGTGNDRQPALSDDAEVLLFESVRDGLGSDDIWMSERDCTMGANAPVTDADGDGTGDACDLAFDTPGTVGGTVPATLALTLGPAATFGAFTPGVARSYEASTTANVVSTAGDALLSSSDPGRLANGTFSLPEPLQVSFSRAAWSAPVSNEAVTITFKQPIKATDALRTGVYSKTLTFTLSTTTP